MLTRRQFLKGLVLAAIAIQIAPKELLTLVKTAEELSIPIFYVSPQEYLRYEEKLKDYLRYAHSQLAQRGIESLMFKGIPVVPFKGNIDISCSIGPNWTYQGLYKRFYQFIN